jgi:hypothetical protein
MVVIAAVDYTVGGGTLVTRQEWTFVGGFFWTAVAYLVGQIIAIPSAAILEHLIARRVFRPPAEIILGIHTPRLRERFLAGFFGIREYRPFDPGVREIIRRKLGDRLSNERGGLNSDSAYQVAFPHARSVTDSVSRMDSFLNQYGLCRNVSFAAIVASGLLAVELYQSPSNEVRWLLTASIALAIGLFVRFMKFYSAHACEVLRTFNKVAD